MKVPTLSAITTYIKERERERKRERERERERERHRDLSFRKYFRKY